MPVVQSALPVNTLLWMGIY